MSVSQWKVCYRHTESPTKSGTQIGKCSDQTIATNFKMQNTKYKVEYAHKYIYTVYYTDTQIGKCSDQASATNFKVLNTKYKVK